jgi:hypothetical protein
LVRAINAQSTDIMPAPSVKRALIELPKPAVLAISCIKVQGYTGNFAQVRRESDGALFEVPFDDYNVPDAFAADTFGGGSQLRYRTVYNQAVQLGASNPLLSLGQTLDANQPECNPWCEHKGIRAIACASVISSPAVPFQYLTGATAAVNLSDCTVVLVMDGRICQQQQNFFNINSGGGSSSFQLFTNPEGLRGGSTFESTPLFSRYHPQRPCVITLSSTPTATLLGINGVETSGAQTNSSRASTAIELGSSTANYPLAADVYAMFVFAGKLTAEQTSALVAQLMSAFEIEPITTATTCVIDATSSLGSGNSVPHNLTPWFQAGIPDDWLLYNAAFGGRSLATLATQTAYTALLLNTTQSTAPTKVIVLDAPSNDISVGVYADAAAARTAMDTLITATLKPFVATLYTQGATQVFVQTVLPRVGFNTTTNFREDARIYYNQQVQIRQAELAIRVIDICSRPWANRDGTETNTTYFWTDQIHLSVTGSLEKGLLDKAAIEALTL